MREGMLYDIGHLEKRDVAREELRHGDLVGTVHDAGGVATLIEGMESYGEVAEHGSVGALEGQRATGGEVEMGDG